MVVFFGLILCLVCILFFGEGIVMFGFWVKLCLINFKGGVL